MNELGRLLVVEIVKSKFHQIKKNNNKKKMDLVVKFRTVKFSDTLLSELFLRPNFFVINVLRNEIEEINNYLP